MKCPVCKKKLKIHHKQAVNVGTSRTMPVGFHKPQARNILVHPKCETAYRVAQRFQEATLKCRFVDVV